MVVELNPLPGILPDPRGQLLLPQGGAGGGHDLRRPDPHRGGHRVAADQRPSAAGRGGLHEDRDPLRRGSDEWGPRTWRRSWPTSTRCGRPPRPGARGRAGAGPPRRLPLADAGPAAPIWSSISARESTARPVRGLRRRHPRADRRAVHRLPRLAHRRLPPEARRQHAAGGGRPPRSRIHPGPGQQAPADFPLPAIVKPAAEDASVGIDTGAVCTTQGRSGSACPRCSSSSTRCWSRSTWPAESST